VFTLDEVREAGRASSVALQPELVTREDVYMLNYTSGTTGDSKGVKISHWGILSSSFIFLEMFELTENDVVIDYLPAPHVFD
jgi:long-chain acyl-CoA synthetase